MKPIIIVGSGLAGYTLAKEFRKADKHTPIAIITANDGSNYSKPMLSNGLSKQKTAHSLATHSAQQMAESLAVKVVQNTQVVRIDTAQQQIAIAKDGGEALLDYASLVLAVGASQISLPIQGSGVDRVTTVNDLDDYAVFRTLLDTAERVAIMGPGLIGCEFANDLCSVDKKVTIIGPDQWPLQHLMPQTAGEALKDALSAAGVDWRLGHVVSNLDYTDGEFSLALDDGETLSTDLVLSAAGLASNTALAAASNIDVNRGIVVDQTLQTSAKNVYAIGDCAEICGLVMPYVMPIMLASKALAKTLQGTSTPVDFPAMPVAVKTPIHPIVVSPPVDFGAGSWFIESDVNEVANGVKSVFRGANNQLLGFALTGSTVMEKMALQRELPAILAVNKT